jgi:hypothetical protein
VVGGVCGAGKCSATNQSAIAAFINNITLTNKTIAYPPVNKEGGSVTAAEEQALQWLIERDPWNRTESNQFRLRQRYALAAFWFSTICDVNEGMCDWFNNTGWLTAENECKWFGITCVDKDVGGTGELQTVVEGIALPNNNLHGGIPVDLGLLQNLKVIDLPQNSLTGSLPESISQWHNLEYFDVSFNWPYLTGSLPQSIGQWTALQTFKALENDMNGTLPALMGQWSNLTYFAIAYNSFSGTLPDSIGNWSNLVDFSAFNNSLTGTIPKSIENWMNIERASFEGNMFTGFMPSGICNAINLTLLVADCLEVNCTCCCCCGSIPACQD